MVEATTSHLETGAPALPLTYIDTHCHLDDAQFAVDVDSAIARAQVAGVDQFINIGYEPARWDSTIALARRIPGMSFTLGLHPGEASRWTDDLAARLNTLIREAAPVAIGEIGIDLYRGETNLALQLRVFNAQLDLALVHKLPVIIHMRSAQPYVLAALNARPANPPLLFHSFEGDDQLTSFVLEHGSIVGVGGLATRRKSATIRQQLVNIPLDRIVLETDSPYLVPARIKTSRNEPANIPAIAQSLAELKGVPLATVARETRNTSQRFFQFQQSGDP